MAAAARGRGGGSRGHGQALAHPRSARGHPAHEGAVERLRDREEPRRRGEEAARSLEPRRHRARAARDRGSERHDVGRRQRPDPRGRLASRLGPGRPVAHRAGRRAAIGLPLPRLRGACLRRRARLLPLRAQGQVGVRVHDQAQPGWAFRAAPDARGSALRPGGLRRAAQFPDGGEAVKRWLVGGAALALGLLLTALWLGLDARVPAPPSFEVVRSQWKPSELFLLDRNGEVIHEQRVDPRRRRLEWVTFADISPALRSAVLTSEDRHFDTHGGVDPRAIAAAAWQRASGHGVRGASTITMQLASMLDPALRRPGGPRSLSQKVRQMRVAWAIESSWSKPQILEAYLNLVTFAGELQGVGAASHLLFDKAPHGLSAPESLVLAAARLASISTRQGSPVALAPHAAARILRGRDASGHSVRVTSTLDGRLQRVVIDTLTRQLLAVRDQRVQDGAVLVVDNATGDVLAYVG